VSLVSLATLAKTGVAECAFGPPDDPFRVVVFFERERIYAFENRCPHFSIPLNFEPGIFWIYSGSELMCAHHSAMFRLEDGVCFDGPCNGAALRKLAVEIHQGTVWCTSPPFRVTQDAP
jgi:nitrite reductase/ring-hydroxylating ferredoxin subunit